MATAELRELRDALQANDAVRITEAIADVVDALSVSRSRRRAMESLASQVTDSADPQSDATTAARSYLSASSKAGQTSLAVLTAAFGYVDGEASTSETLDVVERAVEEHNAASSAEADLRDQKAGVELPALLALAPPDDVEIPVGRSKTVEATVENLGGASATDVTASVDSDLDVSVSPSNLGTVEADDAVSLTLSISGESSGTYDVTLEVAGESDTDGVTVSVVVVEAASYLEQARSLLVQMREQVESLSSGDEEQNGGKGKGKGNGKGNGNGGSNGLSNKLDTAIGRLDDLLEAIERGRPNETAIDNRIDAVGEQVEAFRRQLDALGGKQVPEEAAAALRYNAGQVMSNLELATAADL